VNISKPLIHFNSSTKPIEFRVAVGISCFVAIYVISTGYYFIRKILCCTIMVVIQCPHCSLEVELDDGVSGLFDCPHCGEEFEWEGMDEEIDPELSHDGVMWALFNASLVLILILVILFSLTTDFFGCRSPNGVC